MASKPWFLLLLITTSGLRLSAWGQPASDRPADKILRIGYLSEGTDLNPARAVLKGLVRRLETNPALAEALEEAGYRSIQMRHCDGAADMIQRLGAEEFELAFASSVIYARQFRPSTSDPNRFQPVRYQPILQFRRKNDNRKQRGIGVERRAVIFIGPGSSLWGREPTDDEVRREIERNQMAVSNSNSAAGYIYPQLKIQQKFGLVRPQGFLFCTTSSEVVKHVISGLANIGACDTQTLEELGEIPAAEGQSRRLYQILFNTDLIPTDPILLRSDLLPQRSNLGRELRLVVKEFFNNAKAQPAPGLWVEDAEQRSFEDMARALKLFDSIGEADSSAGAAGRPAPTPEPQMILPPALSTSKP